jgi:hypothetical protein
MSDARTAPEDVGSHELQRHNGQNSGEIRDEIEDQNEGDHHATTAVAREAAGIGLWSASLERFQDWLPIRGHR